MLRIPALTRRSYGAIAFLILAIAASRLRPINFLFSETSSAVPIAVWRSPLGLTEKTKITQALYSSASCVSDKTRFLGACISVLSIRLHQDKRYENIMEFASLNVLTVPLFISVSHSFVYSARECHVRERKATTAPYNHIGRSKSPSFGLFASSRQIMNVR